MTGRRVPVKLLAHTGVTHYAGSSTWTDAGYTLCGRPFVRQRPLVEVLPHNTSLATCGRCLSLAVRRPTSVRTATTANAA